MQNHPDTVTSYRNLPDPSTAQAAATKVFKKTKTDFFRKKICTNSIKQRPAFQLLSFSLVSSHIWSIFLSIFLSPIWFRFVSIFLSHMWSVFLFRFLSHIWSIFLSHVWSILLLCYTCIYWLFRQWPSVVLFWEVNNLIIQFCSYFMALPVMKGQFIRSWFINFNCPLSKAPNLI